MSAFSEPVPKYIQSLVCPNCQGCLTLLSNTLNCDECERTYHIENGIPVFIDRRASDFKQHHPHLNYIEKQPLAPESAYTNYAIGWTKMLDLGCGDGVMSAEASRMVDEVFCLEPNYEALEVLKARNSSNMLPICSTGEQMPFPNNFFDGAFLIFVIEHILDPGPLLREVRRVLKPDGRLVISTDTKFFDKYARRITDKIWGRKSVDHSKIHVNLMYPKELRHCLKQTGFTIKSEDMFYWTRLGRRVPEPLRENYFSSIFVFSASPLS